MYKLFLLTFTCFVGILVFSLASPASASAAGACLTDKSGLTEFQGLTSTDLLARLIYSEAEGESLTGKRGVAYVVKNRINKNLSVFGGNTYSGVILKQGEFQGMTTSRARCSQAWKDSLSIATNSGTNPVGKTLWGSAEIRVKMDHRLTFISKFHDIKNSIKETRIVKFNLKKVDFLYDKESTFLC